MPSHKIHLKIGEEINKKLGLDKDLFLIGCILPDLSEKIPHYISHFKTDKNNHGFYNFKLFKEKYDISNPVYKGYLVHLLTDYYYNDYMRKKYFLYDENRKLNGIKTKNGNYYNIPCNITRIKQNEFTMYDNYLVKNNKYNEIKYNKNIPKIKECDYDLNYLKEYISTYNNDIKNNNNYNDEIKYNILTQTQLDNLFNNCVKYILDYLKNVE